MVKAPIRFDRCSQIVRFNGKTGRWSTTGPIFVDLVTEDVND
jgi:hypothetical protein